MICKNPVERPKADQCLNDEWFKREFEAHDEFFEDDMKNSL